MSYLSTGMSGKDFGCFGFFPKCDRLGFFVNIIFHCS